VEKYFAGVAGLVSSRLAANFRMRIWFSPICSVSPIGFSRKSLCGTSHYIKPKFTRSM